MKIPLYKPFWGTISEKSVLRAMRTGSGTGDGPYSHLLRRKLQKLTGSHYAMPVTSATHAMEMAVACLGAKTGDEVIVPSFTLSATATAVMIRGAKPVFADIDPYTYGLDPEDVARVISKRTVGIITVHYAGMAGSNFTKLLTLAKAHNLWLIEDAAHCIGSEYNGKALGTYGIAGAYSFHGTKNVACGEGGAVVTSDTKLASGMEIFRAIGTDREAFLQGKVSLYQWVGEGSSYTLSDILAALVNSQIDQISKINKMRQGTAREYSRAFQKFQNILQVPTIPGEMTVLNWHIYALKFHKRSVQEKFLERMKSKGIMVSSHYVPLHNSPMGRRLGAHLRPLAVTESVASTLLRMPIYPGLTNHELGYIIKSAQSILKSL